MLFAAAHPTAVPLSLRVRIVPAGTPDTAEGADAAEAVDMAAARSDGSRVVVVPTDTVYGLAALPASDAAVRSVYRLKQRPEGIHLPVLAASASTTSARSGVKFTAAPRPSPGAGGPGR